MPSPPTDDHYAALGVSPAAPHDQIRLAYRTVMRAAHPDVAGSDAELGKAAIRANAAWAVLKDPSRRADYDRRRLDLGATTRNATQDEADLRPSWGPTGPRPITVAQFREAAARESAYSEVGARQRAAFSAASRRVAAWMVLVGALVLLLVSIAQ